VTIGANVQDGDDADALDMTAETIITFSTTAGTFVATGTSTQSVQCANDDAAVGAVAFDAGDENVTFSPTTTGAYDAEAEISNDDAVADANEEGCIGVGGTTVQLVVPKNQPTGQIIVTATTTNGVTASEVLTIATAAGTGDATTIEIATGFPTYTAIGYTSSTAEFNPVANGTRIGVNVKNADGLGVNGVTVQFTTDAGVMNDDDADDTGTGDIEDRCDSLTNLGSTVFATTAVSGTTNGRAVAILCGNSASAGKTATVTITVLSKPSVTTNTKVSIAAKPTSAGITATVNGSSIDVSVMSGTVPAPDNTNIRFAVVPNTEGAVSSGCVSLKGGKASTSIAATPGKQVTVLVTAAEPLDPGATNNATNETAALCGTTDNRTYGSASISLTGGTGTGTGGGGTTGGSGTAISNTIPASGGFGFLVFGGGTVAQLVTASGCPVATMALYATAGGDFVTYIPGTTISAVNAAFLALWANGTIPANTAFLGKCK
jgi:hypothetical protein